MEEEYEVPLPDPPRFVMTFSRSPHRLRQPRDAKGVEARGLAAQLGMLAA